MIKPFLADGKFLGTMAETTRALFFFGTAQATKDVLKATFPDVDFAFLKQVHGKTIVKGNTEEILEADGQFTAKPRTALAIQTADCVPLMLANHDQVCAIHAGWRGTAQGIVERTKSIFVEQPHVAVIGPHIRTRNFEIGRDVMEQIVRSMPSDSRADSLTAQHPNPEKVYFNLTAVLKAQLSFHYPEIEIFDGGEDTFANRAYHSYRREKGAPGRQYSFVMLKP